MFTLNLALVVMEAVCMYSKFLDTTQFVELTPEQDNITIAPSTLISTISTWKWENLDLFFVSQNF